MALSFISPLAITLLFFGRTRAMNDWNVPCLSGHCSYDLTNHTTSGSLQLSGTPNAISDLTPAAGWTILSCNPLEMEQDIRAICTGDIDHCGHLYSGGAVDTLVRLPENCGAMPFARVAREWTHENQTVPAGIQAKMSKRDSNSSTAAPSVRGISLDMNWSAVDPAQNGNVTMFIQGSNAAGQNGNFTVTPATQRRGLASGVSAASEALSLFSHTFNESNSHTVDLNKGITLFDKSIDCPASGSLPAINGEVKVAVDAKAHAVIGYGMVATGTLIPPKISDFGLFANLNGNLSGVLTINASATATFDSGKIPVFQVGIPGLNFPKILTLGPSLVVNAQGIATLDTELDMTVDLAYNINNAQLVFPADSQSSQGGFAPADTGLTLATAANVAASGSIEAHIIPTIEFGLDALDGLAKADINLDLDSSAKLSLSLKAGAAASTSKKASTRRDDGILKDRHERTSGIRSWLSRRDSSVTVEDAGEDDASTDSLDSPDELRKSSGKHSPVSAPKKTTSKVATTTAHAATTTSSARHVSLPTTVSSDKSIHSSPSSRVVHSSVVPPASRVSSSPHTTSSIPSSHRGLLTATSSTHPKSSSPPTKSSPTSSKHSSLRTTSSTAVPTSVSKPPASTSNGTTTHEETSFSGCVDVTVGLTVNAGADGSFFHLFDKSTSVALFTKEFDLFNKCFGSDSTKRSQVSSAHISRRHPRDILARRALTCPKSSGVSQIVQGVIPARSIKPKA